MITKDEVHHTNRQESTNTKTKSKNQKQKSEPKRGETHGHNSKMGK